MSDYTDPAHVQVLDPPPPYFQIRPVICREGGDIREVRVFAKMHKMITSPMIVACLHQEKKQLSFGFESNCPTARFPQV